MSGVSITAVPGLWGEEFLPHCTVTAVGPRLLARRSTRTRAGAGVGESRSCFSVENIHLVLIETFGAAKLEPFVSGSEIQVLFGVADMFAPITNLGHRGERSDVAVYLQHQSGRILCMGVLRGSLTVEVLISGLVAFEVSSSAGSEALLAAEAL